MNLPAMLAVRAFAGVLATLGAAAPAARAQDVVRVPDSVLHQPGALPDRIILTFPGDPARSMAVTWRTAPGAGQAGAQIARLDAGFDFLRGPRTVLATSTNIVTDLGPARVHAVRFEGLEPATRYTYRVGDGEHWSPWAHFMTATSRPEPFAFIYLGDAQNHIASLWSRLVRQAVRDVPAARFILHAGDLVDTAASDAQWGEWHQGGGWANALLPNVPVVGNHEYTPADDPAAQQLTPHWRAQFTLPDNGPPDLAELAYYLDFQGVRLIVLNSNERHEAQAVWLDSLLRDNPNRWTVVALHHPLFSAAGGRDYPGLREVWGRIFDRHRVDLVLQGHDHSYARGTLSADTGSTWRTPGATMYVVSVSGAKMYRLRREPWMQRAAERTQLFHVITVDGERLSFEARTVDGRLYDAFDLVKQRGRANRVVDRIPPDVPERVSSPGVAHPFPNR